MPTIASSQTWTSYIDLETAKGYLQWPVNASTSQDPTLQLIIDFASEWVQNEINRPVAPTQYTERHDGWAGSQIMLNQYPIIELVSATEFLSFGGPIELPESTPDNPVDGVQVNYLTGQLNRVFQGYSWPRPFFPGQRNVEITYVAGYNPIPPTLRIATLELIKWWWINAMQVGAVGKDNPYGAADTASGLWQGVPYRVTSAIAPYRRVVIG